MTETSLSCNDVRGRIAGGFYRFTLAAGVFLLSTCAVSCGSSCGDADAEPSHVTDGIRNSARTTYQSSGFNDPYLWFPPQKELVFQHGLVAEPFDVNTYVGFSPCPLAEPGSCPDDPSPSGEVAESAGDISPISDVNERSFTVRNRTCQTFYLRVTAQADDSP